MNARNKYNELVTRAEKHAENLKRDVPSTIQTLAGKALSMIVMLESCPEDDKDSRLALGGRADGRLDALLDAVTAFEGKTRKHNTTNRITSELWDFAKIGQKASSYADNVRLAEHYRKLAQRQIAELEERNANILSSVPDEQKAEFKRVYTKALTESGVSS